MTRTFSHGHPKVLPACNFLSLYYFYNIFLQKSCRFSLQTLTKFEAAKTGSGVGFLRFSEKIEAVIFRIFEEHGNWTHLQSYVLFNTYVNQNWVCFSSKAEY